MQRINILPYQSLAAILAAIVTLPVIACAGLLVLVILFGTGLALLVVALFTVVPTIFLGTAIWACYVAWRWALGLVFRGTVGSENRVLMRPQASATGNEAHGNLEINLFKVEQKEGGEPGQVS